MNRKFGFLFSLVLAPVFLVVLSCKKFRIQIDTNQLLLVHLDKESVCMLLFKNIMSTRRYITISHQCHITALR